MPQDVLVLGAGMVGVCVALHLQRRGCNVVLVDRQEPGRGASFGNSGIIQGEAAYPHAFPRSVADLRRIAANRAIDVAYHPMALPGLASPLLRYWWNSQPERYLKAVLGHSRLIGTCLSEHTALARDAGATDLLRQIGYLRVFGKETSLEAGLAEAERAQREFGISFTALDAAQLAEAEPHLTPGKLGAVLWTDPYSVSDPHALTLAYAALFQGSGGTILTGDATTLEQTGSGWRVQAGGGSVQAGSAVVALGAASVSVTKAFGYTPPLFGKRGYHMHYAMQGNAVLHRPVLDSDSGYLLVPMRRGVRLTTGAEFADADAEASPVQLERAEPVARGLVPLAERIDGAPWMGVRPCIPDMLPVIGKAPGQQSLWCAFGHAHQGLTMGPSTGRLIAEMMSGEAPFVDPAPYRPDRF